MSLVDRTAAELLADLNARRVSSVEVTKAFIEQIEKLDGKVKAFLRYDGDAALAQAKAIDERRAKGQAVGLLGGLPVAVKDLICTKGELTTCASKILANFRPPYDATIIEKLRAADAVFLGRTNMDEFAMGGSNENSAFFPTRQSLESGLHSRRLQRRRGGRAWPRGWPAFRSAPTPAARSASRPACAASPA